MIENALVFALGALTTAILALVVMPAFTRRAARLARRDLEARMPRTLDEMAAMRDGVRAEYAARTARVQAALDSANQALMDERLSKADMSIQLAALRSERRAYQTSMSEAESRIAAAFSDLRSREEALAQAEVEKRDLARQVARLEQKLAEAVAARIDPSGFAPTSRGERIGAADTADYAPGVFTFDTTGPFASVSKAEPDATMVEKPVPVAVAPQAPIVVPAAVVPQAPIVVPAAVEPQAPIVVADGSAQDAAIDVSPPSVLPAPEPAAARPGDEPVSADAAGVATGSDDAETAEDAEPPRPVQPSRPVASLPPDVAAAIADRLRLARERVLTPSAGPADGPPSVSLPPVAPWSVSLPPPEPEPPALSLPADPERPGAAARKGRRPGIARIGKGAPETSPDGPRPAAVRPGLVEARAALERYTSGETGPAEPPVEAIEDGGKRPVPVVKRARRTASGPETAGTDDPAPPSRAVVEPFDPIANLPPRSNDPAAASYQFPSIAVPAQSPDVDLEPEERSRRVANLARRLKSLKAGPRRPADEDDGAPPAMSGSS